MARGRGVSLLRAFALLGLLVTLTGCSGKSSQDDESDDGSPGGSGAAGGTGGTSGLGGTAGQGGSSAQGGTGGSVQAAKLGLYMMLRNPDPNVPEVVGRSCPTSTGVEWDIGAPVEQNGVVVGVDSPTPTDFGSTVEDGMLDVTITCSVLPDGTFQIDGGGIDPQITAPGGIINFVMSGAANARGAANVLSLAVYTPLTLQMATQAGFPPCGMTNVHEMAPGALWADFDCPALTRVGENVACHARGTIVVEYCRAQ